MQEHIVVAIDSFKGSLSSMAAGETAAAACRRLLPQAEVEVFPLADGGEGTVDALTEGLGGTQVRRMVTGPLGTPVQARYGLLPDHTAIIEMADAAGLTLVPEEKRNPLATTTFGLGELVLAALDRGCRDFLIGIGGSATNDCGIGMLSALGWRFLRADGTPAGVTGAALETIASIDGSGADPRLRACCFRIACDVKNPLCGPQGCAAVFGPQKGATPEIVARLDAAAGHFAQLAAQETGRADADRPGAGAAGGLGLAFSSFLGAELASGSRLCLSAVGVQRALSQADLLITGEGRMDGQTAMGKGPAAIAHLAHELNGQILVAAVCGCALPGAAAVHAQGIDAYFPILQQPMGVEEAMQEQTARQNLSQTVTQILRLLVAARAQGKEADAGDRDTPARA